MNTGEVPPPSSEDPPEEFEPFEARRHPIFHQSQANANQVFREFSVSDSLPREDETGPHPKLTPRAAFGEMCEILSGDSIDNVKNTLVERCIRRLFTSFKMANWPMPSEGSADVLAEGAGEAMNSWAYLAVREILSNEQPTCPASRKIYSYLTGQADLAPGFTIEGVLRQWIAARGSVVFAPNLKAGCIHEITIAMACLANVTILTPNQFPMHVAPRLGRVVLTVRELAPLCEMILCFLLCPEEWGVVWDSFIAVDSLPLMNQIGREWGFDHCAETCIDPPSEDRQPKTFGKAYHCLQYAIAQMFSSVWAGKKVYIGAIDAPCVLDVAGLRDTLGGISGSPSTIEGCWAIVGGMIKKCAAVCQTVLCGLQQRPTLELDIVHPITGSQGAAQFLTRLSQSVVFDPQLVEAATVFRHNCGVEIPSAVCSQVASFSRFFSEPLSRIMGFRMDTLTRQKETFLPGRSKSIRDFYLCLSAYCSTTLSWRVVTQAVAMMHPFGGTPLAQIPGEPLGSSTPVNEEEPEERPVAFYVRSRFGLQIAGGNFET